VDPSGRLQMSRPVNDEAITQARGVVEMVLASVSIGTLGPVASLGYQAGLTPATFGALRAAIGAAILWAILASGRQPRVRLASLPRRQKAMLTAAALVNGLQNLFLFFAFGEMTVALVLLIFWLNPAMIAVASAALGRERLTPLRIGALALAGAGLVLILGSQAGPDANATPAGVLLAGLAAVCHAVYYMIVREGFPSVPAVQATTMVLLGGVLVSGSVAIVVEGAGLAEGWLDSPQAWAAVLVAATIGAALPKVLVIRGVRTIGPTRAALVALVEPVTGTVVATLALGQSLTLPEVVGGGAILLAAAVVQRREAGSMRAAGGGAAGAMPAVGATGAGAAAEAAATADTGAGTGADTGAVPEADAEAIAID